MISRLHEWRAADLHVTRHDLEISSSKPASISPSQAAASSVSELMVPSPPLTPTTSTVLEPEPEPLELVAKPILPSGGVRQHGLPVAIEPLPAAKPTKKKQQHKKTSAAQNTAAKPTKKQQHRRTSTAENTVDTFDEETTDEDTVDAGCDFWNCFTGS